MRSSSDCSQECIAVNRLRFGYGWTVNWLHFLVIVRALAAARNFGPVHNFELPTVIAKSVIRATRVFSLASVGHVTGHMVHDRPIPAAILENFHCEQPCYGFLGLLKFPCSQTLPNLVNCFLIIFLWFDILRILRRSKLPMEKMHQTQAIEVRSWKTSAFV